MRGFTISELVVVVAVLGLVSTLVIIQSDATFGGLKGGTDELITIMKLARSHAMSTTTPHRVVPVTAELIAIEYGGPCGDPSASWTQLADERFELPKGVRLQSTAWDVCFKTRGITTDVHLVRVLEGNSYQDVSVLLGGSVRPGAVHRYP